MSFPPRRRGTEPPATYRRRSRAQPPLRRPIRMQRARLDLGSIRSRPPDLNLTAVIQRYRFGLNFLLKSPWLFPDSTRGPELFEINCSLAQNFSPNPLSFFKLEPAVRPGSFCELDPGVNVYLCFSPRF